MKPTFALVITDKMSVVFNILIYEELIHVPHRGLSGRCVLSAILLVAIQ